MVKSQKVQAKVEKKERMGQKWGCTKAYLLIEKKQLEES